MATRNLAKETLPGSSSKICQFSSNLKLIIYKKINHTNHDIQAYQLNFRRLVLVGNRQTHEQMLQSSTLDGVQS